MKAVKIAWLLLLMFIFGCSSSVTGKTGVVQANNFPAKEYKIQPGDQLDIKFFYNPELNEQLTVRTDGRITLQLVNDVVAAGLTPTELTSVLTKAYSTELSNPKVAVIVRTSIADKIYVDGEVNRAGLFTLAGPTTALQSIAQAGGMKESAKPTEVIVLRRTDDNRITYILVNLEKALQGADPKEDVLLKPNDIIYVPKSAIANVNTWVDLYIRKNIPLPIGLGYSF
jgi:protein involved in polysaccharide export with SLBB domain